jgi:hypothetical protein
MWEPKIGQHFLSPWDDHLLVSKITNITWSWIVYHLFYLVKVLLIKIYPCWTIQPNSQTFQQCVVITIFLLSNDIVSMQNKMAYDFRFKSYYVFIYLYFTYFETNSKIELSWVIVVYHTCDRVAMLQLEIWSHNWRFFIDVQ